MASMKNIEEAIEKVMALDPERCQTAPLRLEVAARIAFPYNGITAAGLRKERDRGRLVTEMIAGKEYTTLADIDRMRELCRVQRREPDLSGARKAARQTAASAAVRDGSSKMEASASALALAELSETMRKKPSPRR